MARGVTARRACRISGISSASPYRKAAPDRNAALKERLKEVWRPNMGYRMAWGFLRDEFAPLNLKRVHRAWRQEGLSRKKRKYKKLRSGKSVPTKAEFAGHVWALDFCHDWCLNGTKLKILNIQDEFTREWLHVEVSTSITSRKLRKILERLFAEYGEPLYIRSDNGPEFIARALAVWLSSTGASSKFIDPGSPWQNGYAESLVSRLRAEILDVELFHNLADAQVKLAVFRRYYNEQRPHSSLGYRPPAIAAAQFADSSRPPASFRLQIAVSSSGGDSI